MTDFLVDTDVLIDISKGNPGAADFVDALAGEIFIGRVSAMELMVGARDTREQKIIETFVARYQVKELSESIGQHAGTSGDMQNLMD